MLLTPGRYLEIPSLAMVNVITKSTILATENVQLKSVRSQIRVRISVGNYPNEKVHDDGITTPDSNLSTTPQTTQPSPEPSPKPNAGILVLWFTQCIHCILG